MSKGNTTGKQRKIPKRVSTLNTLMMRPEKTASDLSEEPTPSRSDAKTWLDKKCRKIAANQNLRNPNARFNNGDTLLHGLLKYGHGENQISYLKKLLQQEADPNMLDYKGETPLMVSCRTSQEEAARIIANHHTTLLDIQDRIGNTALNHAVLSENRQIVETILAASRSRHRYRMLIIRTSEGRTAEEVALSLCRSDLADIIAKERARVQHLFGNVKPVPKPEGTWVDADIPDPAKYIDKNNKKPADTKSKKKETRTKDTTRSDKKKLVSPEPESSPQLPRVQPSVPKMAQSVTRAATVHRARKRFLHLVGVFHQSQ